MNDKYFYRPLAAFHGQVFKCAGICNASNIDMANEMYIKNADPVYLPGFVVLDGYKGDKVKIGPDNVAREFKFGDMLPADEFFVCQVEVRNVYGNAMIYPANQAAELFAKLAGKKTLDRDDLKNIKALGFVVEEVASKKLAA